jgi:hypothetical protein
MHPYACHLLLQSENQNYTSLFLFYQAVFRLQSNPFFARKVMREGSNGALVPGAAVLESFYP